MDKPALYKMHGAKLKEPQICPVRYETEGLSLKTALFDVTGMQLRVTAHLRGTLEKLNANQNASLRSWDWGERGSRQLVCVNSYVCSLQRSRSLITALLLVLG